MSLPRIVTLILGLAYVLVGVIGFIPAATEAAGGADSTDSASGLLFGIFAVNPLHNVVHVGIGAFLLYAATTTPGAIVVARVVGIAYLLIGLLGFVFPDAFGLMPIGGADIALHLATAVVLLSLGFGMPAAGRRGRT